MPATPRLTVLGEVLKIDLRKPYTGSFREHGLQKACIEATYHIEAEEEMSLSFEFIVAQDEQTARLLADPKIRINEQDVPAIRIAPVIKYVPQIIEKERTPYSDTAAIHFKGLVRKGGNEIKVVYEQPLGKDELDRGFFSSRWASEAAYELWPLREWQLAPEFRLEVELRAEDDSAAINRLFFGSDYVLELIAQDEQDLDAGYSSGWRTWGGKLVEAPSGRYEDGVLVRRYEFGPDFPPRIRARVRERCDVCDRRLP